jgi:hypothetical protein
MSETTNMATEVLESLAAAIPAAGDIDASEWGDCATSWRAYVPQELRPLWGSLPREAKLLAAILGDELADRERYA